MLIDPPPPRDRLAAPCSALQQCSSACFCVCFPPSLDGRNCGAPYEKVVGVFEYSCESGDCGGFDHTGERAFDHGADRNHPCHRPARSICCCLLYTSPSPRDGL